MVSMGILRAQPWYEIDYLWIGKEHNDIIMVILDEKFCKTGMYIFSLEYFLILFSKHERACCS